MSFKVEILIVSYARDLPYLRWALKSIRKFANGFSGVTLVWPSAQKPELILDEDLIPAHVCFFNEVPGKGMLHHMHQKMIADELCPEADFILHFDSDQIFREPVTPDDYFVDGKVVILKEPYERLATVHPGRHYWKKITEDALGFETPFETMCRPCQVYPKWLYPLVRSHVENQTKTPFLYWMLMGENKFPQNRCEHNMLGGFAHHRYMDKFHWIEIPKEARPRDKAIQFWSHGPIDSPQLIWLDGKEQIVIPELLIKDIMK